MSNRETLDTPARMISLGGFLSVLIGIGCLIADARLSVLLEEYLRGSHFALFVAGMLLILHGGQLMWRAFFFAARPNRSAPATQHRISLPREGMIYLMIMVVLFTGAMLGRSNLLLLVFAMMVGPFVLNGWLTFSMLTNNRVFRRLPRRALAGEVTSVEIDLTNQKRYLASWLMAVQDHIENGNECLDATVMFTRVPPKDSRTSYYRMRLMQRGRYVFGPLDLSTRFPLGMVERGLIIRHDDELLVHPRIGRLTPQWKREHLAASEIITRQQMRRGIFEDEISRIREFRNGDNPRAIHWRSSARKNELMVREYQQSRNYDLAVYLDLWQPGSPSDADRERVELAVSFCATVCVEFMKQSRSASLRLMAAGEKPADWSGEASSALVEPVLDILALIQPSNTPAIEPMLQDGHGQLHDRTRCLWITTRPPSKPLPKAARRELHDFGLSDERLGYFDVIEADPESLVHFFIWDT
ncbi:MAG: DUF58 domain-containing protein [Planctomycetota bacterium]|nr:DUF58 domain-containing protein [Planctomycetota bacterium]MDA1215207.1 DUF58 domain-containing protein [Planctomycetota bacterium]